MARSGARFSQKREKLATCENMCDMEPFENANPLLSLLCKSAHISKGIPPDSAVLRDSFLSVQSGVQGLFYYVKQFFVFCVFFFLKYNNANRV